MLLKELLEEVSFTCVKGSLDIEISDVIYDSRKVIPKAVFLCISGTAKDAHEYIPSAVEKGAVAVVVEKDVEVPYDVTVIRVSSSRKALAYMAAAYFGHPAKKLTTIGITGTKGKTTTTYMVQEALNCAKKKIGVIGTIGAVIDGRIQKTENTTPESYELQRLFSEMVEAGCECCVMEVSSQGLKMDRVAGFTFDYGVFTNFSADHIGPTEHATMEEYLECKSLLFRQCKIGIFNGDDKALEGVMKGHTCKVVTFGFTKDADIVASNLDLIKDSGTLGIAYDINGSLLGIQCKAHIKLTIPGKFNAYNSMIAYILCKGLGIDDESILEALYQVRVRGRVETIEVSDKYTIMIDYAHNAMSVESLLSTISEYQPKRIICVYGCGGNRSKLRRYDMGELCGKMADLSILTCDNPRDEEIKDINEDIKVGLSKSQGKYIEIDDRKEAIFYSLDHAKEGDIIILLGKGHEEYQEIKGKKIYYNDRDVVLEYARMKVLESKK